MFPYPISFLGSADEAFSSTKSLNFDGVDDYVETPAIFSLLDGLTNFAFSFWFKTSSFSYKQLFWIDGSSATANYAQTQLVVRPNYLIWYFNNNSYYVYANNNLVADTWYHALCTRDATRGTGDKARIYINGVNESASDSTVGLTTLETSTSGLKIGDGDFRGNYSGNIDEVAIYTQDMAAYISEIYNGGTPDDLNNLATAPVPNVWYRMGENATFKSPQILMPEQSNKDKVSNFSMEFDGVNDYIDVGSPSTGTGTHTLSMWINPSTITNDDRIISNINNTYFSIRFTASNVEVWGGGGGWVSVFANPSTSTWTHICFMLDGSGNVTGYKDGVAGSTAATPYNLGNLGIGAKAGLSYGGTFNGKIDEVSIFNSVKAIGDLWDGTGKPTDLTGESGLVGWWRMGEEAVFNSTNWLLSNKAQDVYSRYCLDFDGTDDYVNCGAYSGLNSATAMTASVWFNSSVYSSLGRLLEIGKHVRITQASDTASNTEGRFQYILRGNYGNAFKTLGGTSASGVGNLCDGNWHHLCFVWDNSTTTAIVYEDGVAVITDTSTTGTLNSATETYYIAAENTTPTRPITGKIDEAAIWNIALSPANVAAIYNSGKPTDLTSLSPITWHRMGEDATFSTNWTIPDQIGSNNGTSANMTNDDLTGDAPGVTANGVSANMTIEDRTGDAPDSENNALSYNMDAADIVEDTP